MKVRCIDDGGWSCLETGRVYDVLSETPEFYHLAGVQNGTGAWFKEQFEIVGPKRKSNDPFAGKTILRVNKKQRKRHEVLFHGRNWCRIVGRVQFLDLAFNPFSRSEEIHIQAPKVR